MPVPTVPKYPQSLKYSRAFLPHNLLPYPERFQILDGLSKYFLQHRAVNLFSVLRQGNIVPSDLTAAVFTIGHPLLKNPSCTRTLAPWGELCLSWETTTLIIQSLSRDARECTLVNFIRATVLKAARCIKKYRFLATPFALITRADAEVEN